jgi:hypothetical protein
MVLLQSPRRSQSRRSISKEPIWSKLTMTTWKHSVMTEITNYQINNNKSAVCISYKYDIHTADLLLLIHYKLMWNETLNYYKEISL